jgi:hypothetical protein
LSGHWSERRGATSASLPVGEGAVDVQVGGGCVCPLCPRSGRVLLGREGRRLPAVRGGDGGKRRAGPGFPRCGRRSPFPGRGRTSTPPAVRAEFAPWGEGRAKARASLTFPWGGGNPPSRRREEGSAKALPGGRRRLAADAVLWRVAVRVGAATGSCQG